MRGNIPETGKKKNTKKRQLNNSLSSEMTSQQEKTPQYKGPQKEVSGRHHFSCGTKLTWKERLNQNCPTELKSKSKNDPNDCSNMPDTI